MENGYIESFNGGLRDECLNGYVRTDMVEEGGGVPPTPALRLRYLDACGSKVESERSEEGACSSQITGGMLCFRCKQLTILS